MQKNTKTGIKKTAKKSYSFDDGIEQKPQQTTIKTATVSKTITPSDKKFAPVIFEQSLLEIDESEGFLLHSLTALRFRESTDSVRRHDVFEDLEHGKHDQLFDRRSQARVAVVRRQHHTQILRKEIGWDGR